MDVLKAAFNVVHDGEGGAAAIAELLGKRRDSLDHEVRPSPGSTAKLGLVDAVKISKYRRDWRILYAFADECGHVCIPRVEVAAEDATTQGVLSRAAELAREVGETFQEVNSALADGTVTPNEMASVERECMELIAAVTDVVRIMRAKADQDAARSRGGSVRVGG